MIRSFYSFKYNIVSYYKKGIKVSLVVFLVVTGKEEKITSK